MVMAIKAMSNKDFELTIKAWKNEDPLTLNEAAALWAGETPPTIWIDDPDDLRYDPDKLPTRDFKNIE